MPLLESVIVVLILALATTPFMTMWAVIAIFELLKAKEIAAATPPASPVASVNADDVAPNDSGNRL